MPSAVPTTPAKITAVKPTTIDTLAPKISRDSTSRPDGRCRGGLGAAAGLPGGRTEARGEAADLGIVGREHVGEDRHEGDADEDERRQQREALEPDESEREGRRRRPFAWPCRHLSSRMRGSITA
jgi:hypothetical protein